MILNLPHGRVELPAFFPDGTHAVVRGVEPHALKTVCTQGVEMNAFHLLSRPGGDVIRAVGGIHSFSGFDGPILTDSGGFQLYSLLKGHPEAGTIRKDRIVYRMSKEEKPSFLTPEKCMAGQFKLGSDIMMCLDHCTHADEPYETQKTAVDNTLRWAKACRAEYMRRHKGGGEPGDMRCYSDNGEAVRPLLFAVIQGGGDRDLRKRCAEGLLELGFDGYGFGGWPLDEEGRLLTDILGYVAELVPKPYIVYAMGVGRPEEISECVELGYSLFDCVIPTREARHHRLYVWSDHPDKIQINSHCYKFYYILDDVHIRDNRPVDAYCDCPLCTGYSRAFLRHLFKIGDSAGPALASLHNLRFYSRMMERIRKGLQDG